MKSIDINCDLGEGCTLEDCQKDARIMRYISQCNIACGGHAGTPATMRESIINAKRYNLSAGAHPGYLDKKNFGRHTVKVSCNQLIHDIRIQVDALLAIASLEKTRLTHIKLHGALYSDAEQSNQLAFNIVKLFSSNYAEMSVLGLSGGQMQSACKKLKVRFISEGFIDRAYQANGQLVPRTMEGAVYTTLSDITQQAISIATQQAVFSVEKKRIHLNPDSLCLHGDTPNAIATAKHLKQTLNSVGILIK